MTYGDIKRGEGLQNIIWIGHGCGQLSKRCQSGCVQSRFSLTSRERGASEKERAQ